MEREPAKPAKPLLDARAEFEVFIRVTRAPRHFLSVNSPVNPLRREDGNFVTKQTQLTLIRDCYMWDESTNRWTLKNGGLLVTENEIYDVILSYQRVVKNTSEALWDRISDDVEGVQRRDVERAHQLWKAHKLGELDLTDDALWGRPRAVISKLVYRDCFLGCVYLH